MADTSSTVLILGETGVGKDVVATAIHNLSDRRARPLIRVNCAALPPTLIESELFGHEKGAFTGAAAQRKGRFEIANGSTLFLDEVGELPLDLQAKLLRVLQDGEFERVGGNVTLKTNVRIIAATNRNLLEEVKAGRFREDLWYRLNVFPITLPPLRQRREDIPLLVHHFIEKHCRRMGRPLLEVTRATMKDLESREWVGNVRELESVIERAIITSRGTTLQLADESRAGTRPRSRRRGTASRRSRTLNGTTSWPCSSGPAGRSRDREARPTCSTSIPAPSGAACRSCVSSGRRAADGAVSRHGSPDQRFPGPALRPDRPEPQVVRAGADSRPCRASRPCSASSTDRCTGTTRRDGRA